jgi:hypothetical protein
MPKLSARLRILLITYSMTIGLCACGSGSDNLPVDAPVADTYGEPSQSSAVPSSADTNISSADASSPETEAVADAEQPRLRSYTPEAFLYIKTVLRSGMAQYFFSFF